MRQTGGDSKKRIAFPIQLFAEDGSTDAQIPSEIHVVPTGQWDHPTYGQIEITSDTITEFAQNFNDKVRRDIPITAGHDNGMSGGELPAIGWFTDVIDRGVNGLWAGVKWTDEGVQLLQQRAFKYFSPEFYEDYEDPETRQKYGHVLVGGALTNKPYFKELEPVVAFSEPAIIHQFTEGMNLNDILAKKPEELSDEEKSFVREHQAELTDEQKTAFAAVVEAPAEPAAPAEPETPSEPAPAAPEAPVEASEKGMVKISAAELAALRTKADKGANAFAEVEKMKLTEKVSKMIFSETNTAGRFLPKQKDAVVDFMRALSEKQRDQFVNIVNAMPQADTKLFTEIGDGGSTKSGVFAEIDTKVKEAQKADAKLAYSEALRKVFTENPDLQKRYNEAGADKAA